jgi:hypothetical protein
MKRAAEAYAALEAATDRAVKAKAASQAARDEEAAAFSAVMETETSWIRRCHHGDRRFAIAKLMPDDPRLAVLLLKVVFRETPVQANSHKLHYEVLGVAGYRGTGHTVELKHLAELPMATSQLPDVGDTIETTFAARAKYSGNESPRDPRQRVNHIQFQVAFRQFQDLHSLSRISRDYFHSWRFMTSVDDELQTTRTNEGKQRVRLLLWLQNTVRPTDCRVVQEYAIEAAHNPAMRPLRDVMLEDKRLDGLRMLQQLTPEHIRVHYLDAMVPQFLTLVPNAEKLPVFS